MAQTRIIPGVSVSVVKDAVAPQLSPAGVLGLIGLVEKEDAELGRAATWRTFVDTYGAGSAHSLPEVRQALENSVTELVVVPVSGGQRASVDIDRENAGTTDAAALSLEARAPGTWANDLRVRIRHRGAGEARTGFDLLVIGPREEVLETHANLSILPGLPRSVDAVLSASSSRIRVSKVVHPAFAAIGTLTALGGSPLTVLQLGGSAAVSILAEGTGEAPSIALSPFGARGAMLQVERDGVQEDSRPFLLPKQRKEDEEPAADQSLSALLSLLDELGQPVLGGLPAEGTYALAGGADATAQQLADALGALVDEPDVDMVLVSLPPRASAKDRRSVYSAVIGHCEAQSGDAKGRIGFGEVGLGAGAKESGELASGLVSDRFALVSPQGVLGAVAGRVGSLPYFHSPTFKALAGVAGLSKRLGFEDQQTLLRGQVLPVAEERGRGIIVVRGITTDGDQLSVRRVADRAVRGVKAIGDLFIGRLNDQDGRMALRQKLYEMLLQMEKDGALVPSTDGKDPAFKVNVFSSQLDFQQGVVRVEIAVRPVRAIDFIYATLRVQV